MKFVAAQNAVIIEDNGSRFRYHPKCPYCGYLNDRTTSSGVIGSGRGSFGYFRCPKCEKSFQVTASRT